MTTEIASKSSNVAGNGRSAGVTRGDIVLRCGRTDQGTCRDRDLTSGCLKGEITVRIDS